MKVTLSVELDVTPTPEQATEAVRAYTPTPEAPLPDAEWIAERVAMDVMEAASVRGVKVLDITVTETSGAADDVRQTPYENESAEEEAAREGMARAGVLPDTVVTQFTYEDVATVLADAGWEAESIARLFKERDASWWAGVIGGDWTDAVLTCAEIAAEELGIPQPETIGGTENQNEQENTKEEAQS